MVKCCPFKARNLVHELRQKEFKEYVGDCLTCPENWKVDDARLKQCTHFPRELGWLGISPQSVAYKSSVEYLFFSQISFEFNKAYFLDWGPCI